MKLRFPLLAGIACSLAGLSACNNSNSKNSTGMPEDFKFIDRTNMDTAVSPSENFFLYANGGWLKSTEIPDDQTRWGSFEQLRDRTIHDLHKLMDELAAQQDAKAGSPEQRAGDFFVSGMDTANIEKMGISPVRPILDRIEKIKNTEELVKEITRLHTEGLGQVFGFYISPDDKNVTNQISQFFQGGLGLPSKDYYFDKDARSEEIRQQYKGYIQSVLTLAGQSDTEAAKNAQAIYKLENELASASLTPVEMRNPQKLYNKFSVESLNQLTPGLDWDLMLNQLKIKNQDSVIIAMPDFYKGLNKQLQSTSLDTWKHYLTFHILRDMSPYLSSAFDNLYFDFYGRKLSGQKQQKQRWERVIGVVNSSIGEELGRIYVDRHFQPAAKERMLELVNNLQSTFEERITHLEWMSDVTKQKAIAKLNTFMKKIGYPDKWKDYGNLKIVADNYVQNVLNAAAFAYDYNINKLGKPVDKGEWYMPPQTVNAYYNPTFNEIAFPAAILQFPFFDFNADDAINYGGIGAVIGHEMTHGFDDQGAQYDAEGYLKNWWTPEDSAKFAERTNVVREQFNQYMVLDSIPVNGSLTLGENIADLGGVTIAYYAFKKTKQGQSEEKIDGFTPDQRFFLSWAQIWRGVSTPERTQQMIKVDPHSPEIWRCNGPLSNFEPFYQAFNITEGSPMWRPDNIRARIW